MCDIMSGIDLRSIVIFAAELQSLIPNTDEFCERNTSRYNLPQTTLSLSQ